GVAANTTDIRIEEVSHTHEKYPYRQPNKFAGRAVDRVTLLNVHCAVRTRRGRVAKGFGSMPLGNVWSFPSKVMSYDATLGAMRTLAGRISKITSEYKETAHPVEINHALEPAYLQETETV